jgi:hypothetical protein
LIFFIVCLLGRYSPMVLRWMMSYLSQINRNVIHRIRGHLRPQWFFFGSLGICWDRWIRGRWRRWIGGRWIFCTNWFVWWGWDWVLGVIIFGLCISWFRDAFTRCGWLGRLFRLWVFLWGGRVRWFRWFWFEGGGWRVFFMFIVWRVSRFFFNGFIVIYAFVLIYLWVRMLDIFIVRLMRMQFVNWLMPKIEDGDTWHIPVYNCVVS